MSKKRYLSHAVAAAFVLVSGASNVAFAVDEAEPSGTMGLNDSIKTAQSLVFTTNTVEINGAIGVTALTGVTPVPDVDFYSFDGKQGDLVTLDIDGGMKLLPSTTRHVDTIIAIFKPGLQPGAWELHLQNDNASPVDEGSSPQGGVRDARLDNPPVRLPSDGTYVVGVSSFPRFFTNNGGTTNSTVTGASAPFPNGSYKLTISGVTPTALVQYINIDIKPGGDEEAPLNPKSKGSIPVALLSSKAIGSAPEFRPLDVKRDRDFLTFGRKGHEKSLVRCSKEGSDLNGDGIPDLVCHFDNQSSEFEHSDIVGVVKGDTADGRRFEGSGKLKVKPPTSSN